MPLSPAFWGGRAVNFRSHWRLGHSDPLGSAARAAACRGVGRALARLPQLCVAPLAIAAAAAARLSSCAGRCCCLCAFFLFGDLCDSVSPMAVSASTSHRELSIVAGAVRCSCACSCVVASRTTTTGISYPFVDVMQTFATVGLSFVVRLSQLSCARDRTRHGC